MKQLEYVCNDCKRTHLAEDKYEWSFCPYCNSVDTDLTGKFEEFKE